MSYSTYECLYLLKYQSNFTKTMFKLYLKIFFCTSWCIWLPYVTSSTLPLPKLLSVTALVTQDLQKLINICRRFTYTGSYIVVAFWLRYAVPEMFVLGFSLLVWNYPRSLFVDVREQSSNLVKYRDGYHLLPLKS